MSAFKKLLKGDTPTSPSSNARSSNLGGQGSHFSSKDDDASSSTAGREAGGSEHVDTVSTSEAPALTTNNHPLGARTSAAAPTNNADTTAATQDLSPGGGTAAVGQTTTYSSQRLRQGDPVGSIVDRESTNPLTFSRPEVGHDSRYEHAAANRGVDERVGQSGVTSSAPLAAASAAWATQSANDKMPGAYPGSENPYKATHPLDPRVDGGKAHDPVSSPSTSSPTHHDTARGTGAGVGTGAGPGAAALGASQAFPRDQPAATTRSAEYPESTQTRDEGSATAAASRATAPSTLTTTADPSTRTAEYSSPFDNHGLDSASAAGTTATNTNPQSGQVEEESIVNKVLGAVGLTGAVGAASAALGLGHKDETSGELRDTSAIATQPGRLSQEAGPPKHYRRESIPTTAYPAGLNSPHAVAPPVGGAQSPPRHTEQGSHVGRDAGAAGGAVAGHDFDRSRPVREDVSGHTGSNVATPASGLGIGTATSGAPDRQYRDSQGLHENIASQPTTRTAGTFHDLTTSPQQPEAGESHTGRNVAAGGATAAAVGAGIYGLHEHNKQEPTTLTPARDAIAQSQPSAAAGTTTLPDRTAGHSTYTISNDKSPTDAVAAAPGRYEDQAARPSHTTTTAAAAGATGAGAVTAAAAGYGHERGYEHPHEHEHGHERGHERGHEHPHEQEHGHERGHEHPHEHEHAHEHGHDHEHIHEHPPHAFEVPYDAHEPALYHRPGAAAVGHSADVQAERDGARHAWEVENRGRHEGEAAAATASIGAGGVGVAAAESAHRHGSAARETEGHGPTAIGAPVATEAHHGHHDKPYEIPYGTHETANYNRVGGAALDHTASAQEERDRARHAAELEARRRREREAATVAGTGAVAGGAAYAAHEYDENDERKHQKEAEQEEKKHQKELEKEEKKHQKEAEREEKKHHKQAEEQERKHHKELEREEKAHQKEHDKAVAAAEERERARLAAQEEEDRRRREREVATAAGATGVAGAGVGAHEHNRRVSTDVEGEKKPNIFKRIGRKILRRKNKDTGEEEEYSTDEDEAKPRHSYEHGSRVPKHDSASKGRTVLGPSYEEASGGAQKPSYNPLHKDKAFLAGSDSTGTGPTTAVAAHDSRPKENITGVPYDSQTGEGYKPSTGISGGPIGGGTGAHETEGLGTSTGPTTTTHTIGSGTHTGTSVDPSTSSKPTDPYTGLEYDPAKDPEAARRLSEHVPRSGI